MGGGLPQNFTRMMDGFSTCTRFRYSDSDYMQEKQVHANHCTYYI